jgi:GntR family transcriptional regulator, transcriptional repressor for pyruvate dehydrogenase complex
MTAGSNGRMREPGGEYRIRPLSTISRQEEVGTRIKEYIAENGLRPGDRLPGESWFAAQLSVGRPLVREALKGLEAVGAVEAKKGVGRFVGAFEAESYVRHFTTDVLIHSFSERELTEIRCLLEIAAVSEAVEHLTNDDMDEIRRLLDGMRDRALHEQDYTAEDLGMHRVIMARTGNRFIAAMLDAMYVLAAARVQESRPGENAAVDLAEHEAIAAAVLGRDGRAARQALMRHFETTAARLGFVPRWHDLFTSGGNAMSTG